MRAQALVHGVDIQVACGIPVLNMDTASVFHEHVARMLQAALDSEGKADSLYEYLDDKETYSTCCRQLGLNSEDVMLACVRQKDLRHVKALGSGKRSVMLAVVVALALEKKGNLPELRSMLQEYNLDASFGEILQEARKAAGPPPAREPEPVRETHGVEVHIVCGGEVPVLSMDKASPFSESASWFLQAATNSMKKADSLYAYTVDKAILAECRQLGFGKEEVFIAKLVCDEVEDARGLKAVGVSGKRSVMMSLVVAMLMHSHVRLAALVEEVCGYDPKLRQPITDLAWQLKIAPREREPSWQQGNSYSWNAAPPVAKKPRFELPTDAPSAQELKARAERSKRFEAARPTTTAQGGKGPEAASKDAKPLEGSCPDLEKPYVRLAAAPRACDVRPEPVLREAFKVVTEKWSQMRDWVHVGEMLRSIRQDLTVQMIRTALTVEVYEFCARVALEVGDFKQFDQCSRDLEDLHSDAALGAAGHAPEFLAYRLLYLALRGDCLKTSVFLMKHGSKLKAAIAAGEPHAVLAWRLRGQLAHGSSLKAFRLSSRSLPAEARSVKHLVTLLLDSSRLRQLAALCRACKPAASEPFLRRLLPALPGSVGSGCGGLPLVHSRRHPELLDMQATLAEAERLLGSGPGRPGARPRLGEASSEHMRGFVRAGSWAGAL